MLKLFRARADEPAQAGPSAAEMHGRAAEIADPGTLHWEVLWEALKTEPPADEPSTLTQELGLGEERSIRTGYATGFAAAEFAGMRHGRQVALRIGIVPNFNGKGMNEVELTTAVVPFRITVADGRLVADPGALFEVGEVLAEIAPAPRVWKGLVVEGATDGIRARRPVTAHPQGYVYDLWLVERLADRLGA
jgi:hypothetical protein